MKSSRVLPLVLGLSLAVSVNAAGASPTTRSNGSGDDIARARPRAAAPAAVVGNHDRVVLPCRFSDSPSPSNKTQAYFEAMYNGPKGLVAYFDEASYGRLNMTANVRDWKTLGGTVEYYDWDGSDLAELFSDCTAAHDADIDFTTVEGIDIIGDDGFDIGGLGGTHYGTLDGVGKYWSTTWMPSSNDQADDGALRAHEIGHAFGLPHMGGHTDKASYWDPMSVQGGDCFPNHLDPDFLCLPQHYSAAHKDKGFLGWIPNARRIVLGGGDSKTIKIERLAQPRANDNYLIARLNVPGSPIYYTVEVRLPVGQFDSANNMPGTGGGVIVHKVNKSMCDISCVEYSPVQTMGVDKDSNHYLDPASVYRTPGEVFRAKAHGVKVAVLSKLGPAYKVKVSVEK